MIKDIFTIYKIDLKRIITNYAALIVVIALSILPSLYAWINIKAAWDPYSEKATRGIKIGVINEDEGVNVNNTKINLGNKIVDSLKENKTIGWQFVSEKEANKKLRNGKYYATITIPKSFSKNITSFITSDIRKGEIIYTVNEKINAIAPKITIKGATAVQEKVNETVIKTVSDVLLNIMKDLGIETETTILPKLSNVYNALNEIEDKITYVSELAKNLEGTIDNVNKLIDTVNDNMPLLEKTVSNARNLRKSLSEFIINSKNSIEQYSKILKEDIKLTNLISKELTSQIDTIINAANTGENILPEIINNQIVKIENLNNKIISLINAFESLNNSSNNSAFEGVLSNLNLVKDKIETTKKLLLDINEAVTNGHNIDLNILKNARKLLSNIENISLDLYNNFDTEIKDKINNILNQGYNVTENAGSILNNAKDKLPEVEDSILSVNEILQKGSGGITYVNEILPKVKEVITTLKGKIEAVNNSYELRNFIDLIKNNVSERENFLVSPVQLKEINLYPMKNYGTAMTPFYSVLSIWVGATFLISMLSFDVYGEKKYNSVVIYFGKLLLFATISVMQGLIVALGDLYILKIYCLNPLTFIIGLIFASIVFIISIYSLVSVFGNVGKVISIVLLVLQVAGSGGTFPVQLTPRFFQVINPYLPFTYAISFSREAIGGIVNSVLIKDIIYLFIYAILFIFFSIFLKKPINKSIEGFTNKYKESHIGE